MLCDIKSVELAQLKIITNMLHRRYCFGEKIICFKGCVSDLSNCSSRCHDKGVPRLVQCYLLIGAKLRFPWCGLCFTLMDSQEAPLYC